ncbi:hypothetical protein GCM10023320_37300 [Pseudonocardia adelaidensis]|uniref:Uncharacterized protein n=1 Tax=Pseudonocardia adelaidensis TaxID=648754 RepID=A0ABP9NRU2_9PSEU
MAMAAQAGAWGLGQVSVHCRRPRSSRLPPQLVSRSSSGSARQPAKNGFESHRGHGEPIQRFLPALLGNRRLRPTELDQMKCRIHTDESVQLAFPDLRTRDHEVAAGTAPVSRGPREHDHA